MIEARHIVVRGHVQGVGYRYYAFRAACARQINGWVRNLPDGTVELFAQGAGDALRVYEEDLRTGPAGARVADIEMHDSAVETKMGGFEIR